MKHTHNPFIPARLLALPMDRQVDHFPPRNEPKTS